MTSAGGASAAGAVRPAARGVVGRLLHLLLPLACAGCGRVSEPPAVTCDRCLGALRAPAPFRMGELEVRAAFAHRGAGRDLIHALKYRGRRDVAEVVARLALQSYEAHGAPACDLVVPVPLHPRRLRSRGYNQSRLIAVAIARMLGVEVAERLARRRATRSQTALDAAGRRRNVAGAFAVRPAPGRGLARLRRAPPPLQPFLAARRVVVVDDVVTTGATLGEAAGVLLAGGARSVVAQVGARADDVQPAAGQG